MNGWLLLIGLVLLLAAAACRPRRSEEGVIVYVTPPEPTRSDGGCLPLFVALIVAFLLVAVLSQ